MDELQAMSLTGRIARLERSCTHWRAFGIVATVAGIVALIMGAIRAEREPNAVRATRITVVDSNGRDVIDLGTSVDGRPVLSLLDENGKRRVVIGFMDGGTRAGISFADEEARERLCMKVDSKMGASIAAMDRDRRPRVLLVSATDGTAGLGFMKSDGKIVVQLGINPDNSPNLIVRDRDDAMLFQVPQKVEPK